jgi:hypothetical protein
MTEQISGKNNGQSYLKQRISRKLLGLGLVSASCFAGGHITPAIAAVGFDSQNQTLVTNTQDIFLDNDLQVEQKKTEILSQENIPLEAGISASPPSTPQILVSPVSTSPASVFPVSELHLAQMTPSGAAPEDMGQVTSVSQLSDVKPTDWAYQAVQSLVEKYGCIVGYPDSTFRGNRAATRFELAAALNACLDVISDRFATKEDLAAVRKLMEEFAAELATIRGRVDNLEARAAKLEATQFSTTTKLEGEAIIAATAGSKGNPTIVSRSRLNLLTSFSGEDQLVTQLEFGNGGSDALGLKTENSPFGEFVNPGDLDYVGAGSTVNLSKLYYTTKLVENLKFSFGALIDLTDFMDANSYANDETADFSSGFFINNPFIMTAASTGAGAVLDWNIGGGPVSLRAGYTAADGNQVRAGASSTGDIFTNRGLFGDPYQGTVELEYAPKNFAVRLQYTGAAINNVRYSSLGINGEATFGRFGIFGRFSYADLDGYGGRNDVDFNPMSFMVGLGIKDLLVPGSMLGLGGGQPFIESDLGDATQTNFEAFYRFPINDNISITPSIQYILNPNNSSSESDVVQGTLRTVFTF